MKDDSLIYFVEFPNYGFGVYFAAGSKFIFLSVLIIVLGLFAGWLEYKLSI